MKPDRIAMLMLIALLSVGLLAGCSDDDDSDDPAGPGGGGGEDTTAPEVISFAPTSGETGVAADESIVITFSEAMDPATADGEITLSTGAVTDLTWTDDRTVSVDHAAWSEGAEVTVTVGTGIADTAGNPLETARSVTFYVASTDLVFLGSDPEDGAVDVNRSTIVTLLFSDEMNLDTFDGAVTLTDEAQTDLAFQLHEGDGSLVIVDPDEDLPADETISLTVAATVQDFAGRSLDAPVSVSFTTGQDVDTTPPSIVGFEPASGQEIDPGTTYLRITFSEGVIPDSVTPRRIDAAFFGLVENQDADPVWSDDYTTLTVPLPTPLPAGLPMEVTFADYRDLAGNVQSASATWTATVAGTADYYPLEDGHRFEYEEYSAWGNVGDDTPVDESTYRAYIQFDAMGGGEFHRTWYDETYTSPDDWEIMQKSASALEYLGFGEVDGDETIEVVFDEPLTFVTLPPAGTWSDQADATVPGEGTMTLTGEGEFVSESDLLWLPGGEGHPELFWKDVRLVVIEHTIAAGPDLVETGVDSLWLAPTVGIVRYSTYNVDEMADEWDYDAGTVAVPGIR
ncbi:hypothetical protein GF314_09600 [bacterium]|nr:hypothetical protein [bacterium]